MKLKMLLTLTLLVIPTTAIAQSETSDSDSGAASHLFDDLNGNGISDSAEGDSAASDQGTGTAQPNEVITQPDDGSGDGEAGEATE